MFEPKPETIGIEDRIRMAVRCRDADPVPKVSDAGLLRFDADGQRIQVMHNGLKVVADGYYGEWMSRLISQCSGHHEPQEERLFHEIVSRLSPDGAMLELGGYWAFYSLWFLKGMPARRAIVVEPDPAHLAVGRANAALNRLSPEFVQGFVGGDDAASAPFQTEESGLLDIPRYSVPGLMKAFDVPSLELLHCDVQGAETSVLEGCQALLRAGRIKWVFVSTHAHQISGDPLTHQRCLQLLRDCGAVIEAEHDVHESFSGDGLIVARFCPPPPEWKPVAISHNRHGSSLFRELNYDLDELMSVSAQPAPRPDPPEPRPEAMLELPPDSPLQLSEAVFELNRDGPLGRRGSRLMSPVDKVMFPLIVRDGAWQAEEIVFVGERVMNGAGCTVVDIGANIGLFSRQLLQALPDLDRCLCLEPDPRNFEALKFNLEGYASKVSLFKPRSGRRAGEGVFFRDLENMGNYSLNRDAMRDRPFAEGRIKVVSASEWLSEALADAPRVIWKSDTQGHDEAIIAATPWEIWNKVEAAVVELWRIEKPDFDRQAFRERIAAFPHRRIGKTWMASVDEVEIFLLGKDWAHDDLYLWR